MNKEEKTRQQIIARVADDMPATGEVEAAPVKAGKKKQYTSEAYGHIKIFTPEFIQNIVSRIQASKVETPAVEEAIWSRELAAKVETPAVEEIIWSRKLAAKSFAQKLFDTAVVKKQTEKCRIGINKAAELSEDKEVVAFLEDSDIHFMDKVNLLKDKLGDTRGSVMNLVYQLIAADTLIMLPDIAEEYNRLYNDINGTVHAQVIIAVSLDEEEKAKISQRLGSITGKKVILETEIDPSIIGGIIIRIGDKLIDGSLRGKLEVMHKKIAGL
ncbi:MAG: F0F1 ATP synthase subunit delta [Chloroflexota bacterium]